MMRAWSGVRFGPTGTLMRELVSYYPKKDDLVITSALRSTNDHHGGMSYGGSPTAALDVSYSERKGSWSSTAGRTAMRDFAKWLEDTVPGYRNIVELIHTTPFSTDDGYYVKNGAKLGSYGYGPGTNAEHANHVHLAMSRKQVEAALKKLRGGSTPKPTPKPKEDDPVWDTIIQKINKDSGTSPQMKARSFLAYVHEYSLEALRRLNTLLKGQEELSKKLDKLQESLDKDEQ